MASVALEAFSYDWEKVRDTGSALDEQKAHLLGRYAWQQGNWPGGSMAQQISHSFFGYCLFAVVCFHPDQLLRHSTSNVSESTEYLGSEAIAYHSYLDLEEADNKTFGKAVREFFSTLHVQAKLPDYGLGLFPCIMCRNGRMPDRVLARVVAICSKKIQRALRAYSASLPKMITNAGMLDISEIMLMLDEQLRDIYNPKAFLRVSSCDAARRVMLQRMDQFQTAMVHLTPRLHISLLHSELGLGKNVVRRASFHSGMGYQHWRVLQQLILNLAHGTPPAHEMRPKAVLGAEIGVDIGRTSAAILSAVPELTLLGIDSYQERSETFESVKWKLQELFSHRSIMMLQTSMAAAAVVNHTLDFVYIDADHTYESALEDLEAWAPKVRRGGLVAGHDYDISHLGKVVKAVTEHMSRTTADLHTGPGGIFWYYVP